MEGHPLMMNAKEREAYIETRRTEGFNSFLEPPATKLMLSIIPPGTTPDALISLIESAFNTGYACGQACVLIGMLEETLKRGKL
jgi:hypothetical protein